jgi:hypothetical protein
MLGCILLEDDIRPCCPLYCDVTVFSLLTFRLLSLLDRIEALMYLACSL